MTADGQRLATSLSAFRHVALDETASTNTACLDLARQGDPGQVWVTASRQTSGRGRRGRNWLSEPGNLFASLLLIDPAPLDRLNVLPLGVAVALVDAITTVLPHGSRSPEIKWPNDLLIGGRKCAGILLEGERLADGRFALVIGCGVNVATVPEHGLYPVTSLNDEGASVSPDELFARLFVAMADMLGEWHHGTRNETIIRRWRQAACGIGNDITVNLSDRTVTGRYAGIDDEGRLLLESSSGAVQRIAAGDVFFG